MQLIQLLTYGKLKEYLIYGQRVPNMKSGYLVFASCSVSN